MTMQSTWILLVCCLSVGCGEVTVNPFVVASDAGIDAGDDGDGGDGGDGGDDRDGGRDDDDGGNSGPSENSGPGENSGRG